MVIMMKPEATAEQIDAVTAAVTKVGRKSKACRLTETVMIFVYGADETDPRRFRRFEGVTKVFKIFFSTPKDLP